MRPIRVIMTKAGLDSHYRGVMVVSRYLVSAGMEVIYLGNRLPEEIAKAVVDEDADVLGISSLSGNHRVMIPRVLGALRDNGAEDVLFVLGGIIPDADSRQLYDEGVHAIFGPGAPLPEIRDFILTSVRRETRRLHH